MQTTPPNPDNGTSNNNPFAPFGSLICGSSDSSLLSGTTMFGAPPPSLTEAVPPQGVFHFPSSSGKMPNFLFSQKTTPSSEPMSEPSSRDKATQLLLHHASAHRHSVSFAPSSAMSGFSSIGIISPGTNASSPGTQAFGGSAPAFGCSMGAATAPPFGSFHPSNSLFQTPTTATTAPWTPSEPFSFSINNSAVPSGFSCTFNGFNQGLWAAPSFIPAWANAKRCYCGKVAGIRFSNKMDGTLGMFYYCPDYNEEAIRNDTQDRNYCTYRDWSNSFSLVRRCYCGKVAVLQRSEKFDTQERLFYSCPEYREKDVVTGRCHRDHCSYIEWCSPPSTVLF